MDLNLDKRVALVCGSSSGLGLAIATALAKEASPDENVPRVGPPGVRRARAHTRAGAEEPIEMEIVAPIIHQDERHAINQPGALGNVERAGHDIYCNAIKGRRKRKLP